MPRLDADDLARACAHHGLRGRVDSLRRLTGGASRETWSFDLVDSADDRVPLVLRRDHTSAATVLDRDLECRLIAAAHAGGVPVPAVVFLLDADDAIGSGFVMERVEGETIPRKILRDDAYASARPHLAAQAGRILARVHSLDWTAVPGLAGAGDTEAGHPALAQVSQYRGILDAMGEPHPAFELGLRWLDDNLPPAAERALVHGDYRNGNLIVGSEGIRAVLDWELAHVGDPMEDLGWMCVRSWRFGIDDKPVGGFGTYDDFFAAYEEAGGRAVDPDVVRFWEAFGTLKWGVLCLVQAFSFRSGVSRSVELAALGRRACEMEYDLLGLIA